MYQAVEIYDSPNLYFARNGLKRHDNIEFHDPVSVFLSEYNLLIVSTSEHSYGNFDHKRQNFIPLQELEIIAPMLTHEFPLIGNNCLFYRDELHAAPLTFMKRIIKSKATLPIDRYFGDPFDKPVPISFWLYNHQARVLSGIITFSRN